MGEAYQGCKNHRTQHVESGGVGMIDIESFWNFVSSDTAWIIAIGAMCLSFVLLAFGIAQGYIWGGLSSGSIPNKIS